MDERLFTALRTYRNQLAMRLNLPPYRVLTNQALEEMVEKKPVSLLDLHDIKGMGPVKISQYGQEFVDLIRKFTGLDDAGDEMDEPVAPPRVSIQAMANTQGQAYIFSVEEYWDLVNQMLGMQQVVVEGELSEITDRGKYVFLVLKDTQTEAMMPCFMWGHRMEKLGMTLREGMVIRVQGYGKVYKLRGSLRFEVEQIGLVGEGVLQAAAEELRRKLETEGLFAESRKRPLPGFIRKIGLITSRHGEAIRDFLTHLGEFGFEICHAHVAVEGLYAMDEIVEAIRMMNEKFPDLEALVVTRGGGSAESLQAFNTEAVARAIRASKIPVVTAIGHHEDVSIADLAADVAASTPTHAGRILSDDWRQAAGEILRLGQLMAERRTRWLGELEARLISYEETMKTEIEKKIRDERVKLERFEETWESWWMEVRRRLARQEERLGWQKLRLRREAKELARLVGVKELTILENCRRVRKRSLELLEHRAELLRSQDPELKLRQGYGLVRNSKGKLIRSTREVTPGEELETQISDGVLVSVVK